MNVVQLHQPQIEGAWTPEMVWERIVEAMETLNAMPADMPMGYVSTMPEPVKDYEDAWFQAGMRGDPQGLYRVDDGRRMLVVASKTNERVSRMDEAIGWVLELRHNAKRKTDWKMAVAISGLARNLVERGNQRPSIVAKKLHCSRFHVKRLKDKGLETIAKRLNENKKIFLEKNR